ncbi:MAG: RNA-binding protein [Planctomycetes bacterium]|nr:RNA-binding protein [Planctomycetota bacterium]MCB9888730.1 RNA-binding protein [Planctomycetota bacterium]
MSKKLFVGGLSWGTGDDQLKAAFAEFAPTEAKVIVDNETGRSRGFGFVTFADEDGAKRAMVLDGTQLDGRTIRVSEAQEKRPPREGGRPGGGGGPRSSAPRFGGGGGGGGNRGGGGSSPPRDARRGGGRDRDWDPPRPADDKFARKRNTRGRQRPSFEGDDSDGDNFEYDY